MFGIVFNQFKQNFEEMSNEVEENLLTKERKKKKSKELSKRKKIEKMKQLEKEKEDTRKNGSLGSRENRINLSNASHVNVEEEEVTQ